MSNLQTAYNAVYALVIALIGDIKNPLLLQFDGSPHPYRMEGAESIAIHIAEEYKWDYHKERYTEESLTAELKEILTINDYCAEGWNDTSLFFTTEERELEAESEREEKARRKRVASLLAECDYDLAKLRKMAQRANLDLEQEIHREDWICDGEPTSQGFADAQDLHNERLGHFGGIADDYDHAVETLELADGMTH
jgi:hypothetical protein